VSDPKHDFKIMMDPAGVIAATITHEAILGLRYQQRGTERVLQVGRLWTKGTAHGIDWTDVPTVDESGNPLIL